MVSRASPAGARSYCFAVLGGSFFMNAYLTVNMALARKKYGVSYPALYAPPGHKDEVAFNSVQRANQNVLYESQIPRPDDVRRPEISSDFRCVRSDVGDRR